MDELKKLKPLVLWLRAIESAYMWRSIIKKLQEEFERTPIEQRGPIVAELRKFESMLGNCMMLILGPYKLESAEWWSDEG